MRKIIITILIHFLLPFSIWGQITEPQWINDTFRKTQYPIELWFTGFSVNEVTSDGQLSSAFEKVENSAKANLAEQIQINIESNSELHNSSISQNENGTYSETIRTNLNQEIRATSSVSMSNVEISSWYNPEKQLVYAFAYVERNKLLEYWKNQRQLFFNKTISELQIIEEMAVSGQKANAYKRCATAKELVQQAAYFHKLYSYFACDSSEPLENVYSLNQKVETLLIKLTQSTKIYIDCQWACSEYEEYSQNADILKEQVNHLLTENNCTIVNSPDNADFSLFLTAATTMRSNGSGQFGIISYYADITGKLFNLHSGKIVSSFVLQQDPRAYAAGKNTASAISKAFKSTAVKEILSGYILNGIQR